MGYSVDCYSISEENLNSLITKSNEYDFDIYAFLEDTADCWLDSTIAYGSCDKIEEIHQVSECVRIFRGYSIFKINEGVEKLPNFSVNIPNVNEGYVHIVIINN